MLQLWILNPNSWAASVTVQHCPLLETAHQTTWSTARHPLPLLIGKSSSFVRAEHLLWFCWCCLGGLLQHYASPTSCSKISLCFDFALCLLGTGSSKKALHKRAIELIQADLLCRLYNPSCAPSSKSLTHLLGEGILTETLWGAP